MKSSKYPRMNIKVYFTQHLPFIERSIHFCLSGFLNAHSNYQHIHNRYSVRSFIGRTVICFQNFGQATVLEVILLLYEFQAYRWSS